MLKVIPSAFTSATNVNNPPSPNVLHISDYQYEPLLNYLFLNYFRFNKMSTNDPPGITLIDLPKQETKSVDIEKCTINLSEAKSYFLFNLKTDAPNGIFTTPQYYPGDWVRYPEHPKQVQLCLAPGFLKPIPYNPPKLSPVQRQIIQKLSRSVRVGDVYIANTTLRTLIKERITGADVPHVTHSKKKTIPVPALKSNIVSKLQPTWRPQDRHPSIEVTSPEKMNSYTSDVVDVPPRGL